VVKIGGGEAFKGGVGFLGWLCDWGGERKKTREVKAQGREKWVRTGYGGDGLTGWFCVACGKA